MKFPHLTLLTNTIPPKKHPLLKTARFFKRLLLGRRPLWDKFEGHPAVTRSALAGLKKLNASFNYNPEHLADVAPTVLVLSNLKALRQALDLKKKGAIHTLFAGPILVIDPLEEKELLSSEEIDGLIVPSEWVKVFYTTELPSLKGKCHVWPSGIDIENWSLNLFKKPKKKQALIYDKLDHGQPLKKYRKFLTEKGWDVAIIRYGSYRQEQYRKELQKSDIALFFSPSESQGIALAECWASNVLTFVWNRGFAYYKKREKKVPASSAPYLTSEAGFFFSDFASFEKAYLEWEARPLPLRPLEYVSTHFSDEVSAERLLNLLHRR